jgi:predicted ester cyclase
MTTQHAAAANANGSEAVVLRFMHLMDRTPRDVDAVDEVLAPGLRFQLGAAQFDRNQIKDLIRTFYAAFPDLTHSPEEVLSVADRVVLRTTNRATHTGDFQGIAPTGRRISFGQIAIYRIVDGQISEIWEEADLLGLMQQLEATATPRPERG